MKKIFTIIIFIHFCIGAFSLSTINDKSLHQIQFLFDTDEDDISKKIFAVICEGDSDSYNSLMYQIPYYDYFLCSIHMANEYNYPPAFYRAFRGYCLWNNLYNNTINQSSWDNMKFWLNWGKESGDLCCDILLHDSVSLTTNLFLTLDSINNFFFNNPTPKIISDSIFVISLNKDDTLVLLRDELEQYKRQYILRHDSTSIAMLEYIASNFSHDYSFNENFLFRVSCHINHNEFHTIVFSTLWHLRALYQICDSNGYDKIDGTKLGQYLLLKGYQCGDSYAIIPLAKMYCQGIFVPQDIEYAYKLLLIKMNEHNAKKWINRWLQK